MTHVVESIPSAASPVGASCHDGEVESSGGSSVAGEKLVWQPVERIRRYQWMKIVVGCFLVGIFGLWLVVQWSNPLMRGVSLILMATTAWVVFASIRDDLARNWGRQVSVGDGRLWIQADGRQVEVVFERVVLGRWREDDQPGLWFYDEGDVPIGHMDNEFLADQDEARAFLRWLRRGAGVRFEVRWPETP